MSRWICFKVAASLSMTHRSAGAYYSGLLANLCVCSACLSAGQGRFSASRYALCTMVGESVGRGGRCRVCGGQLKRNGVTSAGRTRWRCTSCGASAVRSRLDVTARAEFHGFLQWLLGPLPQVRAATESGRSLRRRMAWCWAVEALSFGNLSRAIEHCADAEIRKALAEDLNVAQQGFSSQVHAFVNLRNACAHNSRLWNDVARIQASVPNNVLGRAKRRMGNFSSSSNYQVLVALAQLARAPGQALADHRRDTERPSHH